MPQIISVLNTFFAKQYPNLIILKSSGWPGIGDTIHLD